jgi:Family of unknown function (DUF6328)
VTIPPQEISQNVSEQRRRQSDSDRDLDQEWGELIEENRLAMPGTQVLFAFLLVLPFQQRFKELNDGQVAV